MADVYPFPASARPHRMAALAVRIVDFGGTSVRAAIARRKGELERLGVPPDRVAAELDDFDASLHSWIERAKASRHAG